MQIKAVINDKYSEMELHVCNSEMTSAVADMISSLDAYINAGITARSENGDTSVISVRDILYVYAENQHVFIKTASSLLEYAQPLQTLEERLCHAGFFRISRSEIVNLKKIRRLDMSTAGTIRVILSDGHESYTSRRNVSRLKKELGL